MSALERITPVSGAPCWVSLAARDLRTAQSFYAAVMHWEFRDSSLGSGFSVALAHGSPVAGIGRCPGGDGPAAVWIPYFAVSSADGTADRVRERGATLAVGPIPLGDGRAGVAADREGATFGFWEGPTPAWSVGEGAPARLDLQTRHALEAAIFYAEVFDWAPGPSGGCTVDYAQDHVLVQVGGRTVATLRGGAIDADPDPSARTRWIVDFFVPDSEQSAAAAVAHGGEAIRVFSPGGSSESRSSETAFVICDPEGALFSVSDR
ncbi:VOC family protein [Kitasatospora cinereorecta]|uniref:VOC family protein n=1 Tax=Streptomyces sp. NPDC057429 TaxID=3346130 RepID=UPI00338A7827